MTRRSTPVWVAVADGLLDGSVVAFGVWTLFYEVALVRGASATTTIYLWLPAAVLVLAACTWRAVRHADREPIPDGEPPVAASGPEDGGPATLDAPRPARSRGRLAHHALALGAVAAALGAAVLACYRPGEDFLRMLALLGVAAALLTLRTAAGGRVLGALPRLRGATHALAGLTALGVSTFVMFVREEDADDVYYVNRSTWTAEHGSFSLRDTMFGPETLPSIYGGGPPIPSIEGLLGAIARVTALTAAEVTYLAVPPAACLLAIWASWRLVRAWAPRRHLLVLLAAIGFSLMSATGTVGDFSYTRMWTGKVMGIVIVVPLAWVYFTRIAARRGTSPRWDLFMLVACGLAFVGTTSTSSLMAPVISSAVGLAALLNREGFWRQVVGAAAFSLAPVISGLAVVLLSDGFHGESPVAPEPWQAFARAMGSDPWIVAIAVLAMVAGSLLTRSRAAVALAGSSVVVTLATLVPGVPTLMNDLIGTGLIHYRLLLVPPTAILVGMLLAVPLPRAIPVPVRAVVVAGLTAALAALLAFGGTSAWSRDVGARLTSSPELKVHHFAVDDVEEMLALDPGSPVLLPAPHMQVLTVLSTETYSVVPRVFYLKGFPESGHPDERHTLFRFSVTANEPPRKEAVIHALRTLDVALVCVPPDNRRRIAILRDAGYGDRQRAADLVCFSAPTR